MAQKMKRYESDHSKLIRFIKKKKSIKMFCNKLFKWIATQK